MESGSASRSASMIGTDLGAGMSVTTLRNLVLTRAVFLGATANCLAMVGKPPDKEPLGSTSGGRQGPSGAPSHMEDYAPAADCQEPGLTEPRT